MQRKTPKLSAISGKNRQIPAQTQNQMQNTKQNPTQNQTQNSTQNPTSKNTFIKSLIISLMVHFLAILGVYFISKNENLFAKTTPKKVQLSFKRGGDSKMDNSPYKQNTSIPQRFSQNASDSNDFANDSTNLPQIIQIPQHLLENQSKDSQAFTSDSSDSAKNASDFINNSDSAKFANNANSTQNAINLSSLQIYNSSNLNPSQSNYDKVLNYIASKAAPSDVKAEILDLYGDELGDYGLAEIDFLLNNLRDIGRITQYHINRRGYPQGAKLLNQQGKNIIEFYLYPNGDISDLRVVSSANSIILDNDMMTNIKIAFKEYPRPTTKVKIRFFMTYTLFKN